MVKIDKSLQGLFLVIGLTSGLSIGTIITATWHVVSCKCDLLNWQTLLAEGIVLGGGLGSFFFYLQQRENQKTTYVIASVDSVVKKQNEVVNRIDEVVKVSANMAADELKRQTQRKEVWAKIAHVKLIAINAGLDDLYKRYMVILDENPPDEYLTEFFKMAESNRRLTKEYYVPDLDDALSHLVDLLDDPKLFTDIRDERRNFYDIYNMASLPKTRPELTRQLILNAIRVVNEQAPKVQSLLERMKKEIPSSNL